MQKLRRIVSLVAVLVWSVSVLQARSLQGPGGPDSAFYADCKTLTLSTALQQNVCDNSDNNALLWNDPAFLDDLHGSHDLAEGSAKLQTTIFSKCAADLHVRYLLFLDLDGDTIRETVVDSDNLPDSGWIFFNNAANPNYSGGTPVVFDQRPIPADQRFRFGLQTSRNGNYITAQVRWNSTISPSTTGAFPQLPVGEHLLRWIFTHPDGETDQYEYTVRVRDCQPPSVSCLNGLSLNIMPTGMVVLWATDLLLYAQDNNTPSGQLELGIRRAGTGTGFPEDAQGNPLQWVQLDCNHIGVQTMELWVRDAAGNTTSCTTGVDLQDNFSTCQGFGTVEACVRMLCSDDPVEEMTLSLTGTHPALPPIQIFSLTDASGCTDLQLPAMSSSLLLQPLAAGIQANGLNAADLDLLDAYLAGTLSFSEPWQFIAADADRSGVIDMADRDLLQSWLMAPSGTSTDDTWIFLVDTCTLGNHPLAPGACPGAVQVDASSPVAGFFALRLGDLDCSANPFHSEETVIDRTFNRSTPIVGIPYPNPTNDGIYLPVFSDGPRYSSLEVRDLSGRLLYQAQFELEPGLQEIYLNGGIFPGAGMYIWRLEGHVGKITRQ